MIARAGEVAAQPGHWWCDQLNNHDAIAGYLPLGEEIRTQTGGRVDAFVHVVGTAHSIHGVAMALRVHKPALHVVAVEPAESAVLSAGCALFGCRRGGLEFGQALAGRSGVRGLAVMSACLI